MTGNVIMNNLAMNRDVSSVLQSSQSSSAANTVSAFMPQKTGANNTTQNANHTNYFASMTQAKKESYQKLLKEKGDSGSFGISSLFKLDKILEEENKVYEKTKRDEKKRRSSNPFERIA